MCAHESQLLRLSHPRFPYSKTPLNTGVLWGLNGIMWVGLLAQDLTSTEHSANLISSSSASSLVRGKGKGQGNLGWKWGQSQGEGVPISGERESGHWWVRSTAPLGSPSSFIGTPRKTWPHCRAVVPGARHSSEALAASTVPSHHSWQCHGSAWR